MPSSVRHLTAVVATGLLLIAGVATAQYDVQPFDDDPVAISAAFGAEMAVLRLQAAEALFAEGVEEDEIEEVLEGLELEWTRFAHALTTAAPGLAEEVAEAFEAIEDADQPADAVRAALPLALEARAVVSEPRVEDPAFAGAVMVLLLMSETGVAEGWEEAAEGEVGAYAVGWAGMPRLYELWAVIEPQANETQRFEIEDQLGELQALFENPTPPNMDGADPEEGEGAAVHVSGFLEDATGAWLFPDRDLPALLDRTRTVAVDACGAYDAGDDLAGDAHLAWAGFAFEEYLAGTLGMFAPEPTDAIEDLLAPFAGEEEDEDEGASEQDGDGDEDEASFDPASSCAPLLVAFDEAAAAFGL